MLSRDERDVRVLERRLARRDAARPRRRRALRAAAPSARARRVDCTSSSCFCSRSSTVTAVTPSSARSRATVASSTPNTSISVTRPSATPAFSSRRRALADDPALGDHRDPVAERVGLEHVVRRQQHGLARRRQAGDRRAQLARADGVDADRRLVEEDDLGVVQDARARCAAAGACRASSPRPAPARGPSARRARAPRRCAAAAPCPRRRRARRSSGGCRAPTGARRARGRRRTRSRSASAPRARASTTSWPSTRACAARRQQQRDQHLDRRRLAGAVRAEQPEELALLDRERDAAHRLDLERLPPDDAGGRTVGPAQLDGLDHRHAFDPSRCRRDRVVGAAPADRARASLRAGPARARRRLHPRQRVRRDGGRRTRSRGRTRTRISGSSAIEPGRLRARHAAERPRRRPEPRTSPRRRPSDRDGYYPGPAASEPETRVAVALIRRLHPAVTIWFHQAEDRRAGVGRGRQRSRALRAARRHAVRAGALAVRRGDEVAEPACGETELRRRATGRQRSTRGRSRVRCAPCSASRARR